MSELERLLNKRQKKYDACTPPTGAQKRALPGVRIAAGGVRGADAVLIRDRTRFLLGPRCPSGERR